MLVKYFVAAGSRCAGTNAIPATGLDTLITIRGYEWTIIRIFFVLLFSKNQPDLMPTLLPPVPPRPITARAAENGLWLSIYISVLALSMGISASFAPAAIVLWGGSIGLPFFVYRLLRRSSQATGGALSFPELWAEGIASFFLGTLIPALLVYVLLRFVAPGFIAGIFADAIILFQQQGTPEAEAWAESLSNLVSQHNIPSAADVSAQLISFNIIAGTAISLLVSIVVKARSLRAKGRASTGKQQ